MKWLGKEAELLLIEHLLKTSTAMNRLCEAAKNSSVSMERFSSVARKMHEAAQYLQTVEKGLIVDIKA